MRIAAAELFAFAGLLLAIPCVDAHPNHDAVAEADWNPKTTSLEVALRLNASQLEKTLSKELGQAIDLEKPEAQKLLKAFAARSVTLKDSAGKVVAQKWVGAEIRVRSAWLYFEFPLKSKSVIGCELSNTVFFDVFDDQKNTVALKLAENTQRTFLRFSKDSPSVKVAVAEPTKETEIETKPSPGSEPSGSSPASSPSPPTPPQR